MTDTTFKVLADRTLTTRLSEARCFFKTTEIDTLMPRIVGMGADLDQPAHNVSLLVPDAVQSGNLSMQSASVAIMAMGTVLGHRH